MSDSEDEYDRASAMVGDGSRRSRRERPLSSRPERRSLVRLRVNNFHLEDIEKIHLPPRPYNERKCTDLLFLALFLVYWIGMAVIGAVGFNSGNPARLIYGSDSFGNTCGDEKGIKADKKYVVFPRLEKDLDIQIAGTTIDLNPFDVDFFRLCATECPNVGDIICTDEAEALIKEEMATNANITTREEVILPCINSNTAKLFGGNDPACISPVVAKQCFETFFDHKAFLFRCFPEFVYNVSVVAEETGCLVFRNTTVLGGKIIQSCEKFQEVTKVVRVEPPDTSILFGAFNKANRIFERLVGDILKASTVILGVGLGVASLIGLLYVGSLRCYIGCMVWTSVLSTVLLALTITLFCYFKAGILTAEDVSLVSNQVNDVLSGVDSFFGTSLSKDEQKVADQLANGTDFLIDEGKELPKFIDASDKFANGFKYAAYLFTGITLFIAFLIFTLRTRINRSIEFFKEASRAVKSNPTILMVPPVSMCVSLIVVFYWISATAYISSASELDNSTISGAFLESLNISLDGEIKTGRRFIQPDYVTVFNLYLLLGFFWSMSFVNGISLMTISGVVAKWYWSGSPRDYRSPGGLPIFRSFMTAVSYHLGTVAFGSIMISLSVFIRYMAGFFQARFNKSHNTCVRTILMSLKCCLRCAENCIKFISRNSYVITVLYGTPFCQSARMAFSAVATNIAQVATITFLGDIIVRFGQMFITFASAFIAWTIFDGTENFAIGGENELSSHIFPTMITATLAWYTAREILGVYDICIDTILISYCQDRKLVKLRHAHHKEVIAHENLKKFVAKHKMSDDKFSRRANVNVIA